MKQKLSKILLVLAIFLLFPLPSHALERSYTEKCTVDLARTDWEKRCDIAGFDSNKGNLKSVSANGYSYIEGVLKLENKDNESKSLTAKYDSNVRFRYSDGTEIGANKLQLALTETLPKYDGTTDYSGDSGKTSSKLTNDNTVSKNISNLDWFKKETAQFLVKTEGTTAVTGGSNAAADWDTFAKANISVTYTYESYDLAVSKTHSGTTFKKGDQVNFNITVTNVDSTTFSGGIKLMDTLPSGLEYLSYDASGWSCDGGQTVTCNGTHTLNSGDKISLSVKAKITDSAEGTLTNSVVIYPSNDSNSGNNSATDWISLDNPQQKAVSSTQAERVSKPSVLGTSCKEEKPDCTPEINSIKVGEDSAIVNVKRCSNMESCDSLQVEYGSCAAEDFEEVVFKVPAGDGNIDLSIGDLENAQLYGFRVRCINECSLGDFGKKKQAITNLDENMCPYIYSDDLQNPKKDTSLERCQEKVDDKDSSVLGASTCEVGQEDKLKWAGIGAGIASFIWIIILLLLNMFRKKESRPREPRMVNKL